MYRGRLWTMRQFAGFGSAEDTNQRYRFLLDHGQTGLSVAFDMPTLMGHDSDAPQSLGEVGRCGVAVDSVEDMRTLFHGIDLGGVTTSMTINSPASIVFAQYLVVAEEQGIPFDRLGGTLQNDILKEYIAQKEFIFPVQPSMRLVTDVVTFCAENVPRWHPISVSGYHIREAGSTAAQELAFTLADGFAYVESAIDAGLDVDDFAPRLSFFFNSHIDFFEEIAKYRAARRIWARRLREKYGAKNPKSWQLKFHTQTAGCSLTAQQIENNIARTAFEAMAAVLGGTQSLHTNSMDEVLALPTEKAAQIALRTQQILAYETDLLEYPDIFEGSVVMESLVADLVDGAREEIQRVSELGGAVEAVDYTVMERTKRLLLVPGGFNWVDVGSWSELADLLRPDKEGNVVEGPAVLLDTKDSFISAPDKLVAVVGMSGVVVVDTEDALLVCPKSRAQDVKKVVEALGRRGQTDYL
jgi:methylmalonyl-CoA mutase N-terminal domain/subunit